jgi:hypothetical protein
MQQPVVRRCVNPPDNFCYICGLYVTKSQKKPLSDLIKKCYLEYFGYNIRHEGKHWVPRICCTSCYINLTQWSNGKNICMKFGIPMTWREPTNHATDCYFCLVKVYGFSKKKKKKHCNNLMCLPSVNHLHIVQNYLFQNLCLYLLNLP